MCCLLATCKCSRMPAYTSCVSHLWILVADCMSRLLLALSVLLCHLQDAAWAGCAALSVVNSIRAAVWHCPTSRLVGADCQAAVQEVRAASQQVRVLAASHHPARQLHYHPNGYKRHSCSRGQLPVMCWSSSGAAWLALARCLDSRLLGTNRHSCKTAKNTVTDVKLTCDMCCCCRWVEADVELKSVGFPGTWCCQMDDAKVLSGDGCCVRLWSHDTGRRIATLRGHTGARG